MENDTPRVTAKDIIADADRTPFMSWKAMARKYLEQEGALDGALPSKKADIIAALEALSEDQLQQAMDAGEIEVVDVPEDSVEVELTHNYTPFYLQNDDGVWYAQDSNTSTISIPAGLAYLRKDEAIRVLERNQAKPTTRTFPKNSDFLG